jgi:hypothetical protein
MSRPAKILGFALTLILGSGSTLMIGRKTTPQLNSSSTSPLFPIVDHGKYGYIG